MNLAVLKDQYPRLLFGFGAVFAVVLTFVCVALATLNVFYDSGDMTDGAWLATIAWRNNLQLSGPPAFSGSFFTEHVSPIFWLTSLVSYLLPLSKFEFFSAFLGAVYALYAAGIHRLWQLRTQNGRYPLWNAGGACLAALAATFSVIGMQALRLPHHEMAFPPLAMWFLISFYEKKYSLAQVWFVLCLMVREDSGFHLFGLLFLTFYTAKIFHIELRDSRKIWHYAVAAIAYSIIIMLLKNFVISDVGGGVFQRSYVGSPPWHHVTPDLISKRAHYYLSDRISIYLPFLVTCFWAVIVRNPLIPLGFLAFLPWLALSFFATNDTASSLAYYYIFPFWLSLAWPLVAILLFPEQRAQKRLGQWPYIFVVVASLWASNAGVWNISFLDNNNFIGHPFQISEGLENRKSTENFVDYFKSNKKLFMAESLGMDMAARAWLIDDVGRDVWLQELHDRDIKPETLIYFAGGFEEVFFVIPLLQTEIYSHKYKVAGTPIRIASQHDLINGIPSPWPFVKDED